MHPAPSDPKLPKPKGFPGVLVRRRCPHPARQAHPGTGLQGRRAGSPGPRQTHHTCRVPRSELQPPGADSRKRLKGTHRPRVKKSSGQTLTCKESPRKKEQLGNRGLQTSRPPIRFWGDGGRRRVQNQSSWRDCGWVPEKGPGRGGGLSPLPQQQDRAEVRGPGSGREPRCPGPGLRPFDFGGSSAAGPQAARPSAPGVSSALSVLCVSGVWPEGSDGTDINAICRAHERKLLSTGDDFGKVHLFSYPCSQFRVRTRLQGSPALGRLCSLTRLGSQGERRRE